MKTRETLFSSSSKAFMFAYFLSVSAGVLRVRTGFLLQLWRPKHRQLWRYQAALALSIRRPLYNIYEERGAQLAQQ